MVLGCVIKLFQIRPQPQYGFAFFAVHTVAIDRIPAAVRSRTAESEKALSALGYQALFGITTPVLGRGYGYGIFFLGPDGITSAIAIHSELRSPTATNIEDGVTFYSESANAGYSTTNMRHTLNSPPFYKSIHKRRLGVNALHELHQRRIKELNQEVFEVVTPDSAWPLHQRNEKRVITYQIERGVFRSMTNVEVERVLQMANTMPPMPSGPPKW